MHDVYSLSQCDMWQVMWYINSALDVALDVANHSRYIRVLLLSKKQACVRSAFYEALTQHANHTSFFGEFENRMQLSRYNI